MFRRVRISNRHFPAWLERNALFRKIFILYKLLPRLKPRGYYGLPYEKRFLNGNFPAKYKGFFVDVGCFHPTKRNNTYWMYKRGWSGINIDMDSLKIEAFNFARRRDTNVHSAVSDRAEEGSTIRYFSQGIWHGSTSVETLGAGESDLVESSVEKTAPVRTLTAIIDATKYRDRVIDFLTVDAEGHDLQVLRSLDFARYRPRFVVVEHWSETMDEILECDLYRFMKQHGYELINWVDLNLIFRRSAAETKRRH